MKKSKTLITYTSIIMIFAIVITIGFSAFNFNLLIDGIALDVRVDEKLRITSFNPISSTNNGVAKAEDYNINNVYMDMSLPNKNSTITYEVKVKNYGNVEMGISDIVLPDTLKNTLSVKTEGYTLGYKIKDDEDSCEIDECKLTIEKTFNVTISYNSSHTVTETDFNNVLLEFLFNRAYNVTLNNFEDVTYNPNALQNSNYSIELGDALFEVTMDGIKITDYAYTNGILTINDVTGDIVISKILKVDFSYDLDGGTIAEQYAESYMPNTIIELEDPVKEGYIFTGWIVTGGDSIVSGNTLTIGTMPTSIKATWRIGSPLQSYSCLNGSAGSEPYLFAYTGECEVIDDGNGDWRMKLLSGGTFISDGNILVDVFLLGGGGGGGNGGNSDGGGGGGGGYANTGIVKIIKGQSYEIVVGEGGESESAGEASTAFGAIANGGCGGSGNTGGCGGSGGGSGAANNTYSGSAGGSDGSDGKYSRNYSGPGQQMSTREFGETTGTLYAGGGGGGGGYNTSTGNFSTGASGGDGGGVTGGTSNPAANNTGGGGGGGQAGPWKTDGTAGGSGIVIIRNARTATNIELKYDYTGYHIYSLDSNGNWKIKFFTSGTFTPYDNVTIDAFLLGGGGGGGDGSMEDGGGGGGGGYTTTQPVSLVKNQSYDIVIGEGGANSVAGTASTAFALEAAGGLPGDSSANPGAGGSGGGSGGHSNSYTGRTGGSDGSTGGAGYRSGGTGQGTTTREFGETTAVLYAGGGGGGGGYSYTNGNFSLPGYFGSGGAVAGNSASPAAPNFGGGGGGGQAGPWKTNGSAGGSGIVVIKENSEVTPVLLTIALGGGSTIQQFEDTYLTSAKIKLLPATKEGYIFAGWEVIDGDSIISGDTLTIGTTSTTIKANFMPKVVQAIYSETDNSLMFINDRQYNVGDTYNGKTVTAVYTGFANTGYASSTTAPWYPYRGSIKKVDFIDEISTTSLAYWFYGLSSCTEMNIKKLNTSNLASLYHTFDGMSSLTSLDLSHFNTSNVGDMAYTFSDMTALKTLNLGGWKTEKTKYMYGMFRNCSSLTSLDLSSFNTLNVIQMQEMFYNCSGLKTLNIINFTAKNATHINSTFYNCSSLTSLDMRNLELNTNANVNLFQAFYGCSSLTYINLSKADFAKVNGYYNMFGGVPANASVIVKDATQQAKVTGTYAKHLTNVTIAS